MKNPEKYMEMLKKTLTNFPESQQKLIPAVQTLIDDTWTVLDLGCGARTITRHMACRKLVGLDIWGDYLTSNDIESPIQDVMKVIKPNGFDAVIALDVIEHLTNSDGLKMLQDMEQIATKRIIIMTPTQWTENKAGVETEEFWSHGNKYNYHRSFWSLEEFFNLGFYEVPFRPEGELLLVAKDIPPVEEKPKKSANTDTPPTK